jgi:hypothetical protein
MDVENSRKNAKSQIPTPAEMRESVGDLLARTRYVGEKPKRDKHGLTKLAREPSDPDDE